MNHHHAYCLSLLLLLTYSLSQAQEPVYNQFTALDGLAGNTVYCGVQDIYGSLWFGTDKGLSRFDGNHFENIGVNQGLPDPEVLDLYSDSEGSLWISCFKKSISLRKGNVIFSEKSDSILAQIVFPTAITNIFEDTKSQKWILGKGSELYILKGGNLTHKKFKTFVMGVFQIGESVFGIHANGFYRLSDEGDILDSLAVTELGISPFRHFNSCASIGNKLLISGMQLMLFEFDGRQFRLLDHNPNLSGKLFADNKNQCWLPSPDYGAILFSPELDNIKEYRAFLPDKRVNSVTEDSQGGYWFGTIGEGVFRLNPNGAIAFPFSSQRTPTNITTLSENNGRIIAGDDKGNVYQIKPSFNRLHLPSTSNYNKVRQIIHQPLTGDWIGTDKGLFRLHQGKLHAYTRPFGIKGMVFRKDTLWIGSANSLYFLFNPLQTAANETHLKRVTALAVDSDGYLWTGGTNGLSCEKQKFAFNWGERFESLNNRIVSLERAGVGFLWAVTPQDGLMRLSVRNGQLIAVEKMAPYFSVPNLIIQSLYCETSGRLWMATNQGVYALDTNYQTTYFGLRDGLTNLEVNCVLVVRDTLWAGTVSGLSCLPLRQTQSVSNVAVRFSNIAYQLDGVPKFQYLQEHFSGEILIHKEAKLIELRMNVLDFNGAFSPNYTCFIRNRRPPLLDLTFHNLLSWVNAGFSSPTDMIVGPNGQFQLGIDLPAGVYEIQGSAKSKAGNQTVQTSILTLVQKPYWYETVWFWTLVIAFAAYGLYRFLKYRNKVRLMQLHVSELRLLALQAQINPHFVGNSVSAIQQFFYPPDPVKASRYIAIMTRLLRKTMEFSDKHFIAFDEECQYLKDYLDMAQLRFEHRFEYHIEENLNPHTLFPAMLLQPLLENATIHGLAREGKTQITVRFEDEGDRIQCSIRDNGPGLDTTLNTPKPNIQSHKSMGLELIRKKIKTMNALYPYEIYFDIKDRRHEPIPAAGTLVTLSLKKVLEPKNATRHD